MVNRSLPVCTSRAGLTKSRALEWELRRGRILAATDVFDSEPLQGPAHVLLSLPNVLPTHHIGDVTAGELELQFTEIFEQIAAFARGDPIHMANPEALRR